MPLISFVESSITGSDGQFEGVRVTGCTLARGAGEADIRAALQAINQQCRPCGTDFAIRQLALLRARTKFRADVNGTVALAAYADWLAQYPADAAAAACEEWARGMVFWPAWADLQRICDRLVSKRLTLRAALQKALEPAKGEVYLGEPKPETREERLTASINAFLRHGMPARAANAERQFAREQGREPEAWATVDAPPPSAPERPPFKPDTSPSGVRCAKLAKAWHTGKEPPEHGDISEVA